MRRRATAAMATALQAGVALSAGVGPALATPTGEIELERLQARLRRSGVRGRGRVRHQPERHRTAGLQRRLDGDRFRAGERLLITVTGPGYRALRAKVVFGAGRRPLIRRLSRSRKRSPRRTGTSRR